MAKKVIVNKKVDPITLEVIYHRLVSIAEEEENALVRSSMSPIIKESRDCATAVFDAHGRTVAQSATLPIHLGTLISSVPEIFKCFSPQEAKDGDIYLSNDPYAGGTHLWDVTMVVPVIYQGEVVAWAASIAHHMDIGAMTPGVPSRGTSLYQEGLTLPPLKFYDAGRPVKVVHDIIRKNIRIPDQVLGDMGGQVAAGNVGKVRLLELFDVYGKDTVLAAMNQLLDYSEALTREEIEKIPDGTYIGVDYMDNDGIDLNQRIKIQVAITVKGSDIMFDFSGSSPQARGPINSTFASTYSVMVYVVKVITGGSTIPNNEGCFRPIKYELPAGSIVNPSFPASCGARAVTTQAMVYACFAALAKVVPERLCACSGPTSAMLYIGGYDPSTGEEYVVPQGASQGLGARATKDGVGATATDVVNCRMNTIESDEMAAPVRVLESGFAQDSGGPGEYRGGLAHKKAVSLLRGKKVSISCRGERFYIPTWGLCGGLPGAPSHYSIIRKTGEKIEVPSKGDYELNEGDEVHFTGAGGGGYGDPMRRRVELVLRDVLDGVVSLKAAYDYYGVVIDELSMTINEEETKKIREVKTRQRGPINWTIDRGPELGKE